MKKPDFILVGASRCGSTSLYETLIKHPHVILPSKDDAPDFNYEKSKIDISQKELRFFDRNWGKGINWYYDRFIDMPGTITGDASATYLYHPGAIERINRTTPHSKMIILLRNPIDRFISHFHHLSRIDHLFGSIYPSIDHFLHKGLKRETTEHYDLIERGGFYRENVEKCLKLFPNVKIIKSEDLFDDPKVLKDLVTFLALPDYELKLEHFRQSNSKKISDESRALIGSFYEQRNRDLYDLVDVDYDWS